MSTRRISVFFYGLFMDLDYLHSKRIEPVNPRRATLSDYTLRIGLRATLVPEPGAQAHGMLMELTHSEVDHLYEDASVVLYRPEAVLVRPEGGAPQPALVFNLAAAPSLGEENALYATKLRTLAQRIGLPAEYVASI